VIEYKRNLTSFDRWPTPILRNILSNFTKKLPFFAATLLSLIRELLREDRSHLLSEPSFPSKDTSTFLSTNSFVFITFGDSSLKQLDVAQKLPILWLSPKKVCIVLLFMRIDSEEPNLTLVVVRG
jgi:hypothetical protein